MAAAAAVMMLPVVETILAGDIFQRGHDVQVARLGIVVDGVDAVGGRAERI